MLKSLSPSRGFFFNQSSSEARAQAPRWKMAGKLKPLNVEAPEAAEEAEGSEGKWAALISLQPGQKGGRIRPITIMK